MSWRIFIAFVIKRKGFWITRMKSLALGGGCAKSRRPSETVELLFLFFFAVLLPFVVGEMASMEMCIKKCKLLYTSI